MNSGSPDKSHDDSEVAVRAHVRAGVAGAILFGVLPALSHGLIRRSLTTRFRHRFRWIGFVLGLVSGSVAYYSVWEFIRKGRGTAFVGEPPQELVTTGPYRYTRNPQYVSNLGVMLGEALVFNSGGMLLYALLMWFLAQLFLVRWEEPHLTRRFGAAYVAYKRRVPRWLGPRQPDRPARGGANG